MEAIKKFFICFRIFKKLKKYIVNYMRYFAACQPLFYAKWQNMQGQPFQVRKYRRNQVPEPDRPAALLIAVHRPDSFIRCIAVDSDGLRQIRPA